MKHNTMSYIILLSVFILSFFAVVFFPVSEIYKGAMATPGAFALIGALFQLTRDHATHEKQLEIQRKQQFFTLGSASHMASIAFDKHAEFCEKYMDEVIECTNTLFKEGPTDMALNHARELNFLRDDYATWLTNEINSDLAVFEQALRNLGASTHFVKTVKSDKRYAKQRSNKIDESFKLFLEIMNMQEDKAFNKDYAADAIKSKVRNILGIEELTHLRSHIVRQAIEFTSN
ncbi:MAG: hypothetical protein V7752_03680 [Halopseudomonas sp.]